MGVRRRWLLHRVLRPRPAPRCRRGPWLLLIPRNRLCHPSEAGLDLHQLRIQGRLPGIVPPDLPASRSHQLRLIGTALPVRRNIRRIRRRTTLDRLHQWHPRRIRYQACQRMHQWPWHQRNRSFEHPLVRCSLYIHVNRLPLRQSFGCLAQCRSIGR